MSNEKIGGFAPDDEVQRMVSEINRPEGKVTEQTPPGTKVAVKGDRFLYLLRSVSGEKAEVYIPKENSSTGEEVSKEVPLSDLGTFGGK